MNTSIPSSPASQSSTPNPLKSISSLRSVFMAAVMALVAHAEKAEAATTVIGFDTGATQISTVGTTVDDMIFDTPQGTVGVGLNNNSNTSYILGITRTIDIGEIDVNQNGTLSFTFGVDMYTASGLANGTITFDMIPSVLKNGTIVWTGTPEHPQESYDESGTSVTGSHFVSWAGSADIDLWPGDTLTAQFSWGNPGDQNASVILGSGQGGANSPQSVAMTFNSSVPEPGIAGLVGSGLAAASLRRRRKEESEKSQ